ncbi:kinase-like domain-containing protein [Cyathus striatus]|nr:kinase-like domain-containing protein [Cyathus striatus]
MSMSSSAKTHAFFASPFASTSPSPVPPPPPSLSRQTKDVPSRSLTTDFFATPIRSPSPPPHPKPSRSSTTSAPINLSRIFPSRYSKARETIDDDSTTTTLSTSEKPGSSLLFSRPKSKPEFLFFDFDRDKQSAAPQPTPDDDDASHLQLLTDGNMHFGRLNASSLHPSSSPILLSSSASSSSSMYSYASSPSLSRTPSLIDSDSETDTRLPTPPRPPLSLPPFNSDALLREDDATPRPPDLLPSLKVTHLLEQMDSEDKNKHTHASSPEQDIDAPLGPGVIISSDPARILAPSPSPADADAFLSPTVSPLSLTFNLSSSPTQGHFHSPLTSPLFSPPPLPPAPADREQQQAPSRTGTPTPRSFSSAVPNSTLRLIKPLGQGAFSSVWLGEDLSRVPLAMSSRKSVRDLRRAARASGSGSGEVSRSGSVKSRYREKDEEKKPMSLSLSRNGSLKKFTERVGGTRPPVLLGRTFLDERHGEMGVPSVVFEELSSPPSPASVSLSREGSTSSHGHHHVTSSRAASLKRRRSKARGRLVAVKLTPRRVAAYSFGMGKGVGREDWEKEEEERTRVGFVREVEVLRHISHPNITPLLTHLSTPSHHILVLPYLDGGDLHGLVNNDIAWGKLSESVMRRIWCELCKAVGWMHGVGLVHRDIKLENILLTTTAFSALTESSPRPKLSDLPESPAPFIKLSDFGLSRFVDLDENGDAELLTTRCGSEAYSAPEIIMGGGSRGSKDSRGVYDARETDAWACGIVLYALVVRCLPFGEGPGVDVPGRIGDERVGYGAVRRSRAAERRGWLMRIAGGQWEWPALRDDAGKGEEEEEELVGRRLMLSEGARRIVGKLLVRDPRKRARICELWEDEWMIGGALGVEIHADTAQEDEGDDISSDVAVEDEPVLEDVEDDAQVAEDEMEFVDEDDEDGLLLDQEGIDIIARREVV